MKFDDIIAWQRRDAKQEAIIETTIADILDLLSEYGEIPDSLKERIRAITNITTLKQLFKFAIKAGSLEQFMQQLEDLSASQAPLNTP
ncbi:MAG: hypothetical protein IJ747_04605 [Lachnospiraceae bacterium]|nr:hypothetical protein [Lachnospiraceae bacterium]